MLRKYVLHSRSVHKVALLRYQDAMDAAVYALGGDESAFDYKAYVDPENPDFDLAADEVLMECGRYLPACLVTCFFFFSRRSTIWACDGKMRDLAQTVFQFRIWGTLQERAASGPVPVVAEASDSAD